MSSDKQIVFRISNSKTYFKIMSDFVVKDLPTNGRASLGTRPIPYRTMTKSGYCKYAASGFSWVRCLWVLFKISRVCRDEIVIKHGNPNGCAQNRYIIMHLTHCGRDKMTSIRHTTISYSFSWLQNNVCININRNEILIQRVQITIGILHLLTEVYVGSHELNSKRLLVVSIAVVFHWTIFQDCQILHCLYTKQFSLTQKLSIDSKFFWDKYHLVPYYHLPTKYYNMFPCHECVPSYLHEGKSSTFNFLSMMQISCFECTFDTVLLCKLH